MVEAMRTHLPGLFAEKMRSGNLRWRVRPAGQPMRKITIYAAPGDPDFLEQYHTARRGIRPEQPKEPDHIPQSVAWLVHGFEKHMKAAVDAEQMHPNTLKQRMMYLERIVKQYGDMAMAMPRKAVIEHRDSLRATPGAADNAVKAIKALYTWAIDRGHVTTNPAAAIPRLGKDKGAVPWSVDDLRQYRERHPSGMPHLALTLFMFTACRVSDVYRLGRGNEIKRDGILWLDWQPAKKGSPHVTIPMLPPLVAATRAQYVIGATYLLNAHGRPFASSAAFGNWFRDRVREAGLEGRSPHGIRKAAGELLALEGVTQYGIMAVLGHTQAKTSEVYTQGVNRERLAMEAMQKLEKMDW
jgi:integrase